MQTTSRRENLILALKKKKRKKKFHKPMQNSKANLHSKGRTTEFQLKLTCITPTSMILRRISGYTKNV